MILLHMMTDYCHLIFVNINMHQAYKQYVCSRRGIWASPYPNIPNAQSRPMAIMSMAMIAAAITGTGFCM